MKIPNFKRNHELEFLWPWPKIKNFSIQFFLLFPKEDILLVLFISVVFLYPVAKVIKNCFKICQIPFFQHFGNCQNLHILTVTCYSCVQYTLCFLILSYRTKLVQYTSMLVSEIWWTHFEGMISKVCLFFTFFFAFSTKFSLSSMTLITMVTRCHFEILRFVLLFGGHTCFTHKEWKTSQT